MKNKTVLGIAVCIAAFMLGAAFHGNYALYFNLSSLLLVLGGSCGAALVSFRYERLAILARVVIESYRTQPKEPHEIVEILLNLSVKSRFEGILSLEKDSQSTSILFLREALGLLVDGYDGPAIRNYLNVEMSFFKLRRENFENAIRHIADFFPAFGLVGSVVGLIGMLGGVNDTNFILATIPVALTSTVYGIVFSNCFFLPFAANLKERTSQELLLQKIIVEGVVAIEGEVNPRFLERKLKSFLTPASRQGTMVSLAQIRERFKIKTEAGAGHPAGGEAAEKTPSPKPQAPQS